MSTGGQVRGPEYRLSQLDVLESEAIHIIREVVAELARPVLLFSGGKDSIVHAAARARRPSAPGPHPVPGHARRHRPELPRGAGVPRQAGRRARRPARSSPPCPDAIAAGRSREEPNGSAQPASRPPVLLDAVEKHGFDAAVRRRPPRRGEGPGQGAGVLLPRRVRPVGPQEPAPRALEPLQRPASTWASRSGSSRCRTGPSSTSGTTSRASRSRSPRSTSPHEREVVERDGMLYAVNEFIRRRDGEQIRRGARSATAPSATRTSPPPSRPTPTRSRRSSRRSRRPGSPSAARPAATTGSARPPWKTARRRATSDDDRRATRLARKDILRFATAGSVDDGKSTLIGRLLYDSKAIFEDQLEAVERASASAATTTSTSRCSPTACAPSASRASPSTSPTATSRPRGASSSSPTPRGTCSTRATWSPAPRRPTSRSSSSTPARACSSRAAGTRSSPRCCGCRTSCSRQQDGPRRLVGGRLRARSATSSRAFAAKLDVPDLTVVPVSALHGDNVVTRSANMPWYEGPSLLHHLEHVHVASDRNLVDARFPVQYVIRPQSDAAPRLPRLRRHGRQRRAQARRRGAWCCRAADHDDRRDRHAPDGPVDEAFPPMAVTVRLADDLDVSRGDLICRPHNAPAVTQDVDAMVCWMARRAAARRRASSRSSTRPARPRALVKDLQYRLDVNTLHRREVSGLALNDIGRVRLRTTARSSSTTTRATAPPAGSCWSTSPPTPPWAPGWSSSMGEPSQQGAVQVSLPDTSTAAAGNGYSQARGHRIGRTAEEDGA